MRHHNPTVKWSFTHPFGGTVYRPYIDGNYTYEKASPERAYVKVLKFVAEHPNCKRFDIIKALWCPNTTDAKQCRGTNSALFACLLYDDLLDYNCKYEYTVTKKGYDVLRRAGIKEIKIVKTITL